jgi:hypothetical protein
MVLRLDEFLQPMQVVYTLEKNWKKTPTTWRGSKR